jgi:hypothetical protein
MSSNSDIKDEPSEEEFGPASLGLHRVGESLPPKPQASQPPALNRRGMVRILCLFINLNRQFYKYFSFLVINLIVDIYHTN